MGLFGPSWVRRRARAAARARGPLADYYRVPLQGDETPASALRLLAIDVETTGLEPESHQMLSVGWVPVDGEVIQLSGCAHRIIHVQADVGQSAVIHGITDDEVARGLPREDVVAEVLAALAGRVLLAHFARIERGFLSLACEQLYGAPLETPAIDTLVLQDRLVNRGFHDEARGSELRLWNARTRFGLPRYGAHEALTDALACAELYLAQVAEASLLKPQTFKGMRV